MSPPSEQIRSSVLANAAASGGGGDAAAARLRGEGTGGGSGGQSSGAADASDGSGSAAADGADMGAAGIGWQQAMAAQMAEHRNREAGLDEGLASGSQLGGLSSGGAAADAASGGATGGGSRGGRDSGGAEEASSGKDVNMSLDEIKAAAAAAGGSGSDGAAADVKADPLASADEDISKLVFPTSCCSARRLAVDLLPRLPAICIQQCAPDVHAHDTVTPDMASTSGNQLGVSI